MDDSRRFSVRKALGGGAVADLLLWKNWRRSVPFLVCSTGFWFLFEFAGYSWLSFVSNVLLLLVIILFFWAKSAALLNRPQPPIPSLEIPEETVMRAADEVRVWINMALSVAHDIAICGNLKLFGQVAICLWLISYLGSFFSFLSLSYICVLLSFSLPVLYEKYQNPIDGKLMAAYRMARKLPLPLNKEKKIN